MVGMAAAADLGRQLFMWMVGDTMRASVRGWRISAGEPVAAYIFMAKLLAIPTSLEIGTTRLPVKTAPDYGLGRRWRRL